MKPLSMLNTTLKVFALGAILSINLVANAVTWPNTPSGATTSAPPMTMLIASQDHKLFYEAYNDVSDINDDGEIDIRFNPNITYYGLFDSSYCYTYSSNRFDPAAIAGSLGTCPSATPWSGNWLNYVTTSRIDALRKVLYGGYREIDTATETILRRAYIPQDTHSWAKEYTSIAVDGYDITKYTDVALPTGSNRHFFGNVTMSGGTNCATLNNCSDLPPLLSVVTNSNKRVWEWASKERPVLDGSHGGTRVDRHVRVKVCTGTFINGCKLYGTSSYKPTGLLHEYGEGDAMLFGLLSGSYNKNMSGGVLRKVMSSFQNEVNASNGRFTAGATIVKNFDALRIRDFNNGRTDQTYRNTSFRTGPMAEGAYVDWGNPVGEMMFETLRYFAGKKAATGAFDTSGSHDAAVGLSRVATWDNPYESTSTAKADWCARPNMLVMSDSYPSYDGDQIPGSPYSTLTSDIGDFNATSLLDTISAIEPGLVNSLRFAGQTNASNLDYAPTAKLVSSLANVRGLAPEEPAKLGSYSSAAVAFYSKTKGFSLPDDKSQTIESNFVTFASHVPTLEIPVNGRTVRVVPFAKTIDGASTNRNKGNYQPTDPIVDVYVREIYNMPNKKGEVIVTPTVNGGRPYLKYNVIYEADEQGNDFDMDVNSIYTLSVNSSNQLEIEVQIIYQSTGSNQNIGYVISGTNRDGIHLVTSDKLESLPYFLNTPPGRNPGYCDPLPATTETARYNRCRQLPHLGGAAGTFDRSIETFSTSTLPSASFLKDPLWYAAKYGGFVDRNKSNTPDSQKEWDLDEDDTPDAYFLVQNPLKLRESLKKAFDNIIEKAGSGGNVIANSTAASTDTLVYQATYDSSRWSGDLIAYPVTEQGVDSIPTWKASEEIPSPELRKIFYGSDASGNIGKEFKWASFSDPEKTLLDDNEDILNYLRGDRSKEELLGGTLRDRSLNNVLGDIAHSSPFYSKDSDTVFIGANDGMLHAFSSSTGEELFAYIPSAVLPLLKELPDIGYNTKHKYFVDGETAVSSKAQTPDKNYLVTTLGRGGKGLFGLDVTVPEDFDGDSVLWEYFASHADPDGDGADADDDLDLGYMLGRPVIAKMQDGTWAVIVGNGYNSASGKAALYIFNLEDGDLIKKLDTGVAGDNGLATPGVRLDADGEVITIYAGDLKGNLWEFNVSDTNKDNWAIANAGSPLFVAKDSGGKEQPITAPITMKVNDLTADTHNGKLFVYFGTGSYFTDSDPGNTDKQTWYGLIDEGSTIDNRSDLRERTISATGTLAGKAVRVFSEAVEGDMVDKKGFFIDLPADGERMVTSSNYYKLAEPVLIASSIIPSEDTCEPGGSGYINAINPFNGARLTKPFFDVTNDGDFTDDVLEGTGGGFIGSVDVGVGLPGESILIGKWLTTGGTKGIIEEISVNLGLTPFTGRLSWREIVTD